MGTSGERFRVNGGEWIDLPQPRNTPGPPEVYHRTMVGDHTVALPLEELRHGENRFQFTCGSQIKYDFGWGFYWVYSFTVRVFYEPVVPHPEAAVVLPQTGAELAVFTPVQASVAEAGARLVDFVGCYEDFDWEGDGERRKWHYQFLDAAPVRHIGSTCGPPWRVTWDTRWLPDQTEPMSVRARVQDERGMLSLTPAVEGLRLHRERRSVRLYPAEGVPEKFGCRVGERKSCVIPVEDDPSRASVCLLILSTWCGAHADEIALNGRRVVRRVGRIHDVSHDRIAVPVAILRRGDNVFSIASSSKHHAVEVNWPGPALLVEYPL